MSERVPCSTVVESPHVGRGHGRGRGRIPTARTIHADVSRRRDMRAPVRHRHERHDGHPARCPDRLGPQLRQQLAAMLVRQRRDDLHQLGDPRQPILQPDLLDQHIQVHLAEEGDGMRVSERVGASTGAVGHPPRGGVPPAPRGCSIIQVRTFLPASTLETSIWTSSVIALGSNGRSASERAPARQHRSAQHIPDPRLVLRVDQVASLVPGGRHLLWSREGTRARDCRKLRNLGLNSNAHSRRHARSLARSLDRQCPLLPACHTHTHIHASLQSVCRCCLSDLNLHFQNVFSNDRDSSQQTDEHDEDSIQCPSPFQNLEACNGDACGYDRFSC